MIIVHRCSCGHPDIFHGHNGFCENACGCTPARRGPAGPPELLLTFVDGQVNRYVHKPGTRFAPGLQLCGCADCQAFYEEKKKNRVRPPRPPWYVRKAVRS